MGYYQRLFPIYRQAGSWQEFLAKVSQGTGKWVLLQAIEEGWRNKIHSDLCEKYHVAGEEADVLLDRYESLVKTRPIHASVQEHASQLGQVIGTINTLRGYLRYAYYIAVDEPDIIFTILDENLSRLGAGTPTRDECAKSYKALTGHHVNPDAVVLSAATADNIGNHLAAELEDIQRRLSRAVGTAPQQAAKLAKELEELNRLHVELTGKSVLDVEAVRGLREFLTCSIDSNKSDLK